VPQNILAAPETTQEPASCPQETNPRTGKASIKSWAGLDWKIAEILAETDELKRRWQHEAEQLSESETKTGRPS